jgi:thiamine-phosphate diphosphorylase
MRPRLVLITDPTFGDEAIVRCTEAVASALPPGALCVQLRDKQRAVPSLRIFASRLRIATRRFGAQLVINGHARLARDAGADGVHLGGGAGSVADARSAFGRPAWVSVAAHSDDDVRRAVDEGADGVLVSPIFATRPPSSASRAPGGEKSARGLDAIRAARRLAGPHLAVFALGGVTVDRVRPCVAAGANGVAVLRALLASPRPAVLARAIHDALESRW